MGKKKSKSSNSRQPFASLRLPSPDSVTSSNGVANSNGTKHNASSAAPAASSSNRSSASMKHLIHNIIFLIAGLGIGYYFGHEMCFTTNHDVKWWKLPSLSKFCQTKQFIQSLWLSELRIRLSGSQFEPVPGWSFFLPSQSVGRGFEPGLSHTYLVKNIPVLSWRLVCVNKFWNLAK